MTTKSLLWLLAPLLLVGAACGPDAAQQEAARQSADATATAVAAPTAAVVQTAEASATQTAALATQVSATAVALATVQAAQQAQATATAQAAGTATAVAQATEQAKEVEARVQAAISATQQAMPTATPVPPTPTPVVVVVPQQPAAPVYVPVPVPAPGGTAPQFVFQAINEANNATLSAKWRLNPSELLGHVIGRELSRSNQNVRTLMSNRTRVASTFISGYVTSWTYDSPTRITATSNETWRFVNYDADSFALKKDLGARLYRNIYTIDYVAGAGWKVSLDDVPNPSGELV